MIEKNQIILADCMDIMAEMPDNYIDLAVVDPEYGINIEQRVYRDSKKWDFKRPSKQYFTELFRVSKNQIIWGGNYFIDYLYPTKCYLIWDKKITDKHTFSMSEFAWTSFNTNSKTFYSPPPGERGFYNIDGKRIHPTQKPIALCRWIVQKYAEKGWLLMDTHSGSGSFSCGFHLEGFDFIACEKDKDYHRDSVNRLTDLRSQGVLF